MFGICHHDWKMLHGSYGSNWESASLTFRVTTNLHGFCKLCGKTKSFKIANWKMSPEELAVYVKEVYGQ